MAIDKIIEKFREEYVKAYADILSDELLQSGNEWFENFLRSSYSELLGEVVEEIRKNTVKEYYYETEIIELDTAISIINSKLPKEDSIN